VDHVQLQRMDVLLVFFDAGLAVGQDGVVVTVVPSAEVAADVVPHGGGVLLPYPVRVTVLQLAALPAPVAEQVSRGIAGPVVVAQPGRVFDGDRGGALFAEDQQVVSSGNTAAGGIFHDGLVGEVFGHGAVTDGEGFFPDSVPGNPFKPGVLVDAD